MALTKIDDRGLTTPIDLLDDEKIRFGTTDNDLEIFHGSNISTIKDGKGDLRIMGNTIRIQRNAGGENFLYATEGGKTSLYYDGSEKLETYASGVKATGNILTTTGDISCATNSQKITAGAGDDLQIYHDGSDSWIDSSTNNLAIRTTNAGHISIKTNNEYGIFCAANGAVSLYYDNSPKFETASHGITALGDVFFDNQVNAGKDVYWDESADRMSWSDNVHATFGNGEDLRIYHDGSYNRFTGANYVFMNAAANEYILEGYENGAVKLYYDNVEKTRTTSAGMTVFGNDSNYDTIKLEAQSAGGDPSISFGRYGFSTTSRGAAIKYTYVGANTQETGHLDFYTNPDHNSTGSLNHRLRIHNVGDLEADDTTIGTLSDSRLKKNIADYTYDLAKFKQLKPRTFDWINPEEHIRDTAVRGFIAQEVRPVDDYYIRESTFGNKKDKELITDGKCLTSKLGANDAMYVSVINQLITKVETLETEVAALKAK